MAVEIRELVIKTNIVSSNDLAREKLQTDTIALLKKQIVQECLKVLQEKTIKHNFDR